jgi:uncharacterized membrane protein YfcA
LPFNRKQSMDSDNPFADLSRPLKSPQEVRKQFRQSSRKKTWAFFGGALAVFLGGGAAVAIYVDVQGLLHAAKLVGIGAALGLTLAPVAGSKLPEGSENLGGSDRVWWALMLVGACIGATLGALAFASTLPAAIAGTVALVMMASGLLGALAGWWLANRASRSESEPIEKFTPRPESARIEKFTPPPAM